ncbi:MAG TPA: HEAT repeat domain-containing protein [Candidatus Angelobacter sp.]|nr:HEAT repeat domain-containing protein [Candidatus Angelobacter sp.]
MKTAHRFTLLIFCMLTIADFDFAQKPRIENAKIQELSAASGLKPAIDSLVQKETGPLWVGYKIPAAAKDRSMCCLNWNDHRDGDGCCMGCRLESGKENTFSGTSSNCAPEPVPYAFVFLRVESRQIQKVRVFSADCPLDFAGLPVYWLNDTKPEQSVELLTGMALSATTARDDESEWHREPSHQAVMAIAMHDSPSADQALEKLIQPGRPLGLRKNVAFWLVLERGKKGLEILEKYVKNDSDDDFRAKATFAISQSKEPGAVQDLIGMAHSDPSPHVRGQAIFWLAQIGGRKVAEQITAAIENDPETEVKKKAVFALSQLHDGSGVPLLISVARTNKNPVVRKQAIFWLGQSHDPRALDYLEEILTK